MDAHACSLDQSLSLSLQASRHLPIRRNGNREVPASYEITGHESSGSQPHGQDVEAGDRRLSHLDVARITKVSSIITVLVAGLALFSDGYNAQIIGYMPCHCCIGTKCLHNSLV
ncbi:hypothetical protein CLAIMM_03267 isoform 1, partial [Cladophialophora immunda]